MPSTIYVAGPMTGRDRWNFDAFEAAEARLKRAGLRVLSPAAVERATGFDPDAPAEEFTDADRQKAMRRDLALILGGVDAVAVLDGWEDSSGAKVEVAVAQAVGIPVGTVESFEGLLAKERKRKKAEARKARKAAAKKAAAEAEASA